jgi:hypothetical protein
LQCFHRDFPEKKSWNNFVQSVRAKLTVKSVVDGVRNGAECSFDFLLLLLTAEYVENDLFYSMAISSIMHTFFYS